MSDTHSIFAANVRSVRARRGLSQSSLASKAGMSRQAIHRIENLRSGVTLETVSAISRALDVAPWRLLRPVLI